VKRPKRHSKQTLSLANEALEFISKPALNIQSIELHPRDDAVTYVSPYHATFLNGAYGKGRLCLNKKDTLSLPRFQPESVGVLTLPSGSWSCVLCSTVNESGRPLHLCRTCMILPTRQAKLQTSILSTSKYAKQVTEESKIDSDSDCEDEAFSWIDERKVSKEKEMSEYGKKWTSKDTRGANEETYKSFCELDSPIISGDKATLRWTCIASPLSDSISSVVVAKKCQLQKPLLLKEILSKMVVAVQKNLAQLVCAYSLHRSPHAVMGKEGVDSFAKSFGAKVVFMDNVTDHYYDTKHPNRPMVCNTNRVPGCNDFKLMGLIGVPSAFKNMSLLQQVRQCLLQGLLSHGNEYVEMAMSDDRGTMSFHAGVSPREGAQWHRKNGCGIAFPGLRQNSLRASVAFRNWLLHLEVLIAHSFVEKFLSGTDRDQQAIPCRYCQEVLEEWMDYLGCPTGYEGKLRIGGGLSRECQFSCGSSE
jgi:hypothetical protein